MPGMTHLAAEPSTVLSFHVVRIGDAPVFPADEALCSSRSFAPTYLSSFHLSLPVLDLRFPYPFFQKKRSLAYSQYSTSPNPFVSVTGPCRFKTPALLSLSLPVFLLSPPRAPRPDLPYCLPLRCFNARALDSDNPRSLTIDAEMVIGFSNAGPVVAKVFPNGCAVERTPG